MRFFLSRYFQKKTNTAVPGRKMHTSPPKANLILIKKELRQKPTHGYRACVVQIVLQIKKPPTAKML